MSTTVERPDITDGAKYSFGQAQRFRSYRAGRTTEDPEFRMFESGRCVGKCEDPTTILFQGYAKGDRETLYDFEVPANTRMMPVHE